MAASLRAVGALCLLALAVAAWPLAAAAPATLPEQLVAQQVRKVCAQLRFSGRKPASARIARSSSDAGIDRLIERYAGEAMTARDAVAPEHAVKQADGSYLADFYLDLAARVPKGRALGCGAPGGAR